MKQRQPEPVDSPQSSTSSWSPPELRPYNLRQRTSLRRKRFKMSHDRVGWDTDTTRVFLNLCILEKNKLNFSKGRLTNVGWQNIYKEFPTKTVKRFTSKQLHNKFAALKRQYESDRLAGCSGRYPFQHELDVLFGDTIRQDGNILCVGGIRDRTPSAEYEHSSPSSPAGNARYSSHRSGHEVDSPPPKRPKSVEMYLERALHCLEERSKNESSMLRRQEKHENMVKQLLQTVHDDGVEIGSELYFIAGELFRDETRRATFSTLVTPEQRIRYLNWAWEKAIKK